MAEPEDIGSGGGSEATKVTYNKVRFGAKNAYIAIINEDGTYGTPFAMPGLQSVDINNNASDSTTFYADDSAFYSKSNSGSIELTVQMTKFPDAFRTQVLGQTRDSETGVLIESPDDKPKEFAFMFQTSGDQGGIKVCYCKCTSTVPTYNAQTNNDSLTEDPETATFTVSPTTTTMGGTIMCYSAETGDPKYEDFFKAVLIAGPATAAPGSGQ